MQTFLPVPSLTESPKYLDYRRLGKQRVECLQILNVLTGKTTSGGWKNHPATRMWRGYEDTLGYYMNCCIDEWKKRGYKNNISYHPTPSAILPTWWFSQIHASHRSNLLRKNPSFYNQWGWSEPNNLPYYWPV